jgi:peptide deformylase
VPLKIAQLGQPVLWKQAAPVSPEEIGTPAFQQFLADMRETLEAAKGAGLAAPQVFDSRRVFLAAVLPPLPPSEDRGIEVFINPRLVAASAETAWAWEGCLSFEELLVHVERRRAVRVEYLNAAGEARTLDLADFPARVIQHEYDHLEGILTLDRAPSRRHIIKASEIEAYMEAAGSTEDEEG